MDEKCVVIIGYRCRYVSFSCSRVVETFACKAGRLGLIFGWVNPIKTASYVFVASACSTVKFIKRIKKQSVKNTTVTIN